MLKKFALAISLCVVLTSSAHANLLSNPGFETGDLTGWTVGGSAPRGYGVATAGQALPAGYYGPSVQEVNSGNFAAWVSTAHSLGDMLTLTQTLTLSAGTYDVGFYYGSNQGPYGNSTGIFLDGTQIGYGISNIVNGFQLEFANFVLTTSGSHQITFDISGSGTAPVSISVDDFYLNNTNAVPEPGTLALLALGLFGFGMSRRRKQ